MNTDTLKTLIEIKRSERQRLSEILACAPVETCEMIINMIESCCKQEEDLLILLDDGTE